MHIDIFADDDDGDIYDQMRREDVSAIIEEFDGYNDPWGAKIGAFFYGYAHPERDREAAKIMRTTEAIEPLLKATSNVIDTVGKATTSVAKTVGAIGGTLTTLGAGVATTPITSAMLYDLITSMNEKYSNNE